MTTLNLVGDWIVVLTCFVGVPVGLFYLRRWAARSERREFNLQYGKSLSKGELRKARRVRAREDRRRFWRKATMALLPWASIGRLRRAENNLDDEALVEEVYEGFGFGVVLTGLLGVVGSIEWVQSDGVVNPLAWALLAWGIAGVSVTRRWWRLIKAFRAEHGGRMPGQDPESESARRSIWCWERDQRMQADIERTGLKARHLRKYWHEEGLL